MCVSRVTSLQSGQLFIREMVMGYEKENHVREGHGDQDVGWMIKQ
jgi:hypothetical protein